MNDSDLFVRRWARAAGWAYLLLIALGAFGEIYVRSSLLVLGDALATSTNIAANPGLWRTSVVTDLLMRILDVPLIVFFYLLLRPVHHGLALTATALNLVQTAVLVANKIVLTVPCPWRPLPF